MEPIAAEEAEEMREVLEKFYGPIANHWNITYRMYEVLGNLITASKQCTQAMHLMPHPWDLAHPLKWASKQVRQAIIRYLKTPDGQQYIVCMRTSARNFRTEFELASQRL